MVDFKKLQEMDGLIIGIEIASENARYVLQDVTDEYFSLSEKSDRERSFSRGQVKSRIVYDYILEVEKLLKRLVPIFNTVFEEGKPEKCSGGFPNEEIFRRIYGECFKHAPQAPENIEEAYEAMQSALNEYIDAIEEYVFRYSYQWGYEAAKAERKGGVAV